MSAPRRQESRQSSRVRAARRARPWIGVGLCLLPQATLRASQSVKLNGPMPQSGAGRIVSFQVTSDGGHVVYSVDQDQFWPPDELYGVPTDGSASPVQLNLPLTLEQDLGPWQVTPDGSHVVFVVYWGGLMSAPVNGSAPPIHIAGIGCATCDDSDFAFQVSADGTHVLYRPEENHFDPDPLYAVPVDGSQFPVQLSEPGAMVTDFRTTLDGSRALFVSSIYGEGTHLFCRAIDGSSAAVMLDVGLGVGYGQPRYSFTPDGSTVVFSAYSPTEGLGLYAAPIDGGSNPIRLSEPMTPYGDIVGHQLSPDGTWVLYSADAIQDGRFELFSASIDASGPVIQLNHALAADGDVRGYQFSPDSTRVMYSARENGVEQIYSVPCDRSQNPVRINGRLVPGGQVMAASISPDSRRVVYVADERKDGLFELYISPIDGGRRPRVRRPAPAHGGSIGSFRFGPDGTRVVYTVERDTLGTDELYSLAIDGSAPPLQLNAALPPGALSSFEVSADGRAVFLQTAQSDSGPFLYSVPIDLSRLPLALAPP
ncbi:MAG: hypothetical protein HOP15_12600 [Planctomycetes bacterium]|nr:hypothetical protein [Planctomycetota bacterium]